MIQNLVTQDQLKQIISDLNELKERSMIKSIQHINLRNNSTDSAGHVDIDKTIQTVDVSKTTVIPSGLPAPSNGSGSQSLSVYLKNSTTLHLYAYNIDIKNHDFYVDVVEYM